MHTIFLSDKAHTHKFGRALGNLLQAGDVLALMGALGTGKTFLVQAIGEGMGLRDPVTSPTFSLVQEYRGPLSLIHIDVYRISDTDLSFPLELEEYFHRPAVVAVEWADKVASFLPEDRLEILLEAPVAEREERLLHLQPRGARASELLQAIERSWP